jgi:hypothetical protein
MSTTKIINGITFQVVSPGDDAWGDYTTALLQALCDYSIFTGSGSTRPLTQDLDLGSTYGVTAAYFTVDHFSGSSTNPAQSGTIRLANGDTIAWRNADNSADIVVTIDSSNRLKFASDFILTATSSDVLTNKSIDASTNTVSNLDVADFAVNVVDTDTSLAADSDSRLATQKATKSYIDTSVSTVSGALTSHLNDTIDAHDASAISSVASGNLAATDVQAALNELQSDIDSRATSTDLSNHINDTTDAHAGSAITNTPSGNLAATTVQAALNELQSDIDSRALSSDLTNHINDTTDAHAASAITNTPSGNLAATTVQAALNELQSDVDSKATSTDLTNHLNDTTDAHAGSAITNTPSGNLAATTVQEALNELQSDVDSRATTTDLSNHLNDTTDAHAGSAITNTPTGNLAATDVQSALNELQSDIDSRATSTDLSNHLNDIADAHAASAITNTPSGNLAATTVQGALNELQSDINTRVTLTGVEQITNKDIDGGTANNSRRITIPKNTTANIQGLDRKEATLTYSTDGQTLLIDNGSSVVPVGGGGGLVPEYKSGDFTAASGKMYLVKVSSADITCTVPTGSALVTQFGFKDDGDFSDYSLILAPSSGVSIYDPYTEVTVNGTNSDTYKINVKGANGQLDWDGTNSRWVLSLGGYSPIANTMTSMSLSGGTDSSSATTGDLVVSGGVGIGKKLYVGGVATFSSGAEVPTNPSTPIASATQDGNAYSGTYTPSITNVSGTTIGTIQVAQYMRVGKVVTVSGSLAMSFSDSTDRSFKISTPITRTSNFGSTGVGAAGTGVAVRGGGAYSVFSGKIIGKNGEKTVLWESSSNGADCNNDSHDTTYIFTYTLD